MASRVGISGLAAVLAVLGAVPAWAQIQAVTLFVNGGGYSAVHNVFNLTTGTTDDFKIGFTLGGGVGLQVHKYVEVRATLTGAQSHLRQNGLETTTYLNRYYVGLDVKGQYPLPGGVTPYALAGGGGVILHEKGTTGQNTTQGFGHIGVGVAYPIEQRLSVYVQGDGFFYSLSGLTGGALSAYHSAQFDVAWSVGASYKFPL